MFLFVTMSIFHNTFADKVVTTDYENLVETKKGIERSRIKGVSENFIMFKKMWYRL